MKDRGMIKWTSMMLPEHVQMLREWESEDDRQTMPILDEQWLEKRDRDVRKAMIEQKRVKVSYIQNGREQTIKGVMKRYDPIDHVIIMMDRHNEKARLSINVILSVSDS